jgi:hypothetical protein
MAERQRWLQWTVLGYEMFATLGQPHYGERAVTLKETGEIIGAVGIVPYLDTFNRVAAFKRPSDAPPPQVGLLGDRPGIKARFAKAARAIMEYLFTTKTRPRDCHHRLENLPPKGDAGSWV